MSSNSDDIQAAGSDTRPPMLDRTDYESWSQRSIATVGEGKMDCKFFLPRTYEDLSDTEKKRYDADVRATNIVLQGLPKDIYKLINHNIEAKAIWDNVKMLLAAGNGGAQNRAGNANAGQGKPVKCYNFNRVGHKVGNRLRFVTAVKLNKGLEETNHEQLYAYLNQHEKHVAQDRLIIERITPATNDQLAFVSTVQPHAHSSHVQSHQYPSSSTNPQSPQYPQFPETSQIVSGYTQTDEILDHLTKQMALLAQSFRATLPQTNNKLRTSSNTQNQATIQDAGNGGAQNRAGNANAGQGKPVKCYNCNRVGHKVGNRSRFVTAVKLNNGLEETNHEQLYAYLKQHEKDAAQDRLIIERITPATNDQLAFVSTVQPQSPISLLINKPSITTISTIP
ncbi:hypothetical protein Tco_0738178 [Tanacetum coccineum]